MPATLSVNLNAVAALRNRRDLPWPSVAHFGAIALAAGAHGLTVHPRPDQRHIRFSDVPVLRDLTANSSPYAEFNIEGFPSNEFLELCERYHPDQVTLVPDAPSQSTSDHGWDCVRHEQFLSEVVERLHRRIKRVSLFCDPDATADQIDAAARTGADRVELYTGPYGATYAAPEEAVVQLTKLQQTAMLADQAGLGVNAGHDLTVANLPGLAQVIPHLSEVSIGHALIADALEFGLAETVRRFIRALA